MVQTPDVSCDDTKSPISGKALRALAGHRNQRGRESRSALPTLLPAVALGTSPGAHCCAWARSRSAWWVRDEAYVEAGNGLGYQLGIAGATMMLLLALYSVRKRVRALDSWGPLTLWFRVHMYLGVLGPLAILYHCNFQLGSLNSSLALISMLLVAGSGVVGRPHLREDPLRPLRSAGAAAREASRTHGGGGTAAAPARAVPRGPGAARRLREALRGATPNRAGCAHTPGHGASQCRASAEALLQDCSSPSSTRSVRPRATTSLSPAGSGGLAAYERLFRLWHAVHVPAVRDDDPDAECVHVLAVHLY